MEALQFYPNLQQQYNQNDWIDVFYHAMQRIYQQISISMPQFVAAEIAMC